MIVESELLHYGSMAALLLGIRIIFAAIRPPVLRTKLSLCWAVGLARGLGKK